VSQRFSDIVWSDARRYWLANARVPSCFLDDNTAAKHTADAEGVVDVDVLVEDGALARVEKAADSRPENVDRVDLGGRQMWPTLIDIHTHLDKGHTVQRSPNVDGTFDNAILATAADRPHWTVEDLRRRMDFGLRCARAHGVSAIRTHIDTYPDTLERSWRVVTEMHQAWRGRIDLQAVSLCPIDSLADDFGDRVAAVVAKSRGILGGFTRGSIDNLGTPSSNIDAVLDRVFTLAKRHDLDLDLHVDESGDPAAATLPLVASAVLRHGYMGRVVCGHCCSLAVQPERDVERTLDLVAEAEIAIVTLPAANMYLQDRQAGRTPRWRGVTVVQEMRQRAIRVAVAGDNCRDSFYAYGDYDVLDTFRQAVRILHVDHPLKDSPALVGPAPAVIGRFDGHGRIAAGLAARLIVLNARTINEVVSRPHSDRVVIDRGRRQQAPLPEYSELWDSVAGS
jgi:cytosine deaminase